MSKFELKPEQQDQFDKEGTMTEKEKDKDNSQKDLSEAREKMVKALEAMGKNGYVYKEKDFRVRGEINGVRFSVSPYSGIIYGNPGRDIPAGPSKDIYEKYYDIAIEQKEEEQAIKKSNYDIEEHDKKHKLKEQRNQSVNDEDIRQLL